MALTQGGRWFDQQQCCHVDTVEGGDETNVINDTLKQKTPQGTFNFILYDRMRIPYLNYYQHSRQTLSDRRRCSFILSETDNYSYSLRISEPSHSSQ